MSKNSQKKQLSAREIALIGLYLQEIESIDHSLSSWFYQGLAILGAIGLFLYQVFPFTLNIILVYGISFFLFYAYSKVLDQKFVKKLYSGLESAIKNGTLAHFKIRHRTFREKILGVK